MFFFFSSLFLALCFLFLILSSSPSSCYFLFLSFLPCSSPSTSSSPVPPLLSPFGTISSTSYGGVFQQLRWYEAIARVTKVRQQLNFEVRARFSGLNLFLKWLTCTQPKDAQSFNVINLENYCLVFSQIFRTSSVSFGPPSSFWTFDQTGLVNVVHSIFYLWHKSKTKPSRGFLVFPIGPVNPVCFDNYAYPPWFIYLNKFCFSSVKPNWIKIPTWCYKKWKCSMGCIHR